MIFLFSIGILVWFAFGFLARCEEVAWHNTNFAILKPSKGFQYFALLMGPIGLIAGIATWGWYKPQLRFLTQEERLSAIRKEYPYITEDQVRDLDRGV